MALSFIFFVIFLIFLLILLLLAGTLWIELIITNTSSINIRVGICWLLYRYRLSIPLHRFKPQNLQAPTQTDSENSANKTSMIKKAIPLILSFVRSILPHSTLEVIGSIIIGTGDAAETGFLVGILWQFLGVLNWLIQVFFKNGTVDLRVFPEFNAHCLDANISCIVFLPMLHIITAVAQTIGRLSKRNYDQGGRRLWPSILFKD